MANVEDEIEALELQFETKMLACSVKTLRKLADGLRLDEGLWKGKRKNLVIKMIRKEGDVGDDVERKDLLVKHTSVLDLIIKEEEKDKMPLKEGSDSESESVLMSTPTFGRRELLGTASIFRKDFRIIGQIGEPHQKEKLTFISLTRQVEEAVRKKYPEQEIIAGILKAIVPRSLRSYLELMQDLSLPKLCQVLRIHYREKSATELYQELIEMRQEKDEEASQFLIRALDVREKIVFTAKEDEGSVRYTKETVQGLFLKTIESGLDQEVASRARTVLLKGNVSDVELISEINLAEESVKLRKQKQGPPLKEKAVKLKISAVQKQEESEMLLALKEMRTQITSLQDQVQDLKNNPVRRRSISCEKCTREGKDKCDHCLRCGETGHMARGCSGNRLGRSLRD